MNFEDETETAIFAEPFVVDTILATSLEAAVIGEHLFLTFFSERPQYMGHERVIEKIAVSRIAFALSNVPAGRMKITLALAQNSLSGFVWPDVEAGHG